MAKATGGVVGQIAGTIGGITFQNWRGIQTLREKPTPHNPKTARQMEVRAINTELSRAWRDVLNQGQRIAWNQRATTFSWKTILGKTIKSTGENLFIKQNFQLLDFGLDRQITPPPLVMPPELTDIILEPQAAQLELKVPQIVPGIITAQTPFLDVWIAGAFTSVLPPAPENGAYVAIINSEALSQGRVHQNSDFRHAFYAADLPITEPPSDPAEIFVNIPGATVRNVVLLIRRYNQFGNYSQSQIFGKIISAA